MGANNVLDTIQSAAAFKKHYTYFCGGPAHILLSFTTPSKGKL